MVKKKAKEEEAQSKQPKAKASSRSKRIEVESAPSLKDYEESQYNEKAVNALVESWAKQDEAPTAEEQKDEPEENNEKPKLLHILAADRLNSLIKEANELGITDVVQILNSDKFGQFYLVYRE